MSSLDSTNNGPRGPTAIVFMTAFAAYAAAVYFALPRDVRALCVPLGLLLALVALSVTVRWLRIVIAAASAVIVFGLSWLQVYEVRFGRPAADTYVAVFQSTALEAWSYFLNVVSARSFLLAGFVGLVAPVLYTLGERLFFIRQQSLVSSPLAIAAGFLILLGGWVGWSPLEERARVFRGSVDQFEADLAAQRRLLVELAAGESISPTSAPPAPASFEGTVVLVIGESLTRRHMSVYGYFRPTTPNLDRRRRELLIHKDTISAHSHTVPAIQAMLTAPAPGGQSGFGHAFRNSLLVELHRGGFKTWWLSNQAAVGVWDNPVALIGKQAQVSRFLHTTGRRQYGEGFYDEALLPYLDQALADDSAKQFIVLHTIASHNPYCRYVPDSRRPLRMDDLGIKYFGNARDRSHDVNCYDNAVRYVDELVEQIIRRLERLPKPALLAFVSDHDEDADYGTLHNSSAHMASHVEIPHVWYFNQAARSVLAAKIRSLENTLTVPYISSGHFHTVLDIVGADRSRFTPARSLASGEYHPLARSTVARDDGAAGIAYDDLSVADAKDYLEMSRLVVTDIRRQHGPGVARKVWAHRTDTIGKLLEAKTVFDGVELDIVFDMPTREFYVYHPPVKNSGLRLSAYLAAASDRKDLQFWFDWKNVNAETFGEAMALLKAYDQKFALRERCIVETPTDATFAELKEISAYGFRHAYYLPTEDIARCSSAPSSPTCAGLASRIARTASAIGASAISYDSAGQPFVDRENATLASFGKVVWRLRESSIDRNLASRLGDLKPYEAVLVTFPSKMNY